MIKLKIVYLLQNGIAQIARYYTYLTIMRKKGLDAASNPFLSLPHYAEYRFRFSMPCNAGAE